LTADTHHNRSDKDYQDFIWLRQSCHVPHPPTPVPEPSTVFAGLGAIAMLFGTVWRRVQRTA
jgi:hypothetical protein